MEILHQLISPASRTFESLGLVANLFGVITGALLFYFYLCRLNAMNAGPVVPEQEA